MAQGGTLHEQESHQENPVPRGGAVHTHRKNAIFGYPKSIINVKAKPFRPDDRVTIINPLVVVRVGYPLGIEDGEKFVRENKMDEISRLASSEKARCAIVRAMAVEWLQEKGFGGRERAIHTKIDESLRGKSCRIIELRNRVCGTYRPGYSGGYFDPYDTESPELKNRTFHRIAELDIISDETSRFAKIEIVNLEPYKEVILCVSCGKPASPELIALGERLCPECTPW